MEAIELQFSRKGFVDKIGMQRVTGYIDDCLEKFDTSLIEWIKLLPLDKKHILHGECAYPVKNIEDNSIIERGYRIRASVNVESVPPYKFSHWGRIPSNSHKQGWCSLDLSQACNHFFTASARCGDQECAEDTLRRVLHAAETGASDASMCEAMLRSL